MESSGLEEIVGSYEAGARIENASTIPAAWYVDARVAELERRSVFGRTWQVVGRADQLRAAGDFISAELAGEPIVAVRGADKILMNDFQHAGTHIPRQTGERRETENRCR